jgi:hypothetical protein
MHIERMLVLSTGHVSKEVNDILEGDWKALAWGPEFVRDEGWVFRVVDDDIIRDTDPPQCIRDAMSFARGAGCEWVMFDCDGDRVEILRWHDW